MSRSRAGWALLLAVSLVVSACGDDDADSDDGADAPASTAPTESPDDDDDWQSLDAGTVPEPPRATGSVVTAEQADAVSRSVLEAWMGGDRTTADKFATDSEALDALFADPAPSQEFSDDGEGYCSIDPTSGGFIGCSYSVVDDSADGILAVATELEIAGGLVLVRSVGPADWND